MGHEVQITGCILGTWIGNRHADHITTLNRSAIAALPQLDDFPPLSSSIFNIDMTNAHFHYRAVPMPFGVTFKDDPTAPGTISAQWIEKFEALLGRMAFEYAYVYISDDFSGDRLVKYVPCVMAADPAMGRWSQCTIAI